MEILYTRFEEYWLAVLVFAVLGQRVGLPRVFKLARLILDLTNVMRSEEMAIGVTVMPDMSKG